MFKITLSIAMLTFFLINPEAHAFASRACYKNATDPIPTAITHCAGCASPKEGKACCRRIVDENLRDRCLDGWRGVPGEQDLTNLLETSGDSELEVTMQVNRVIECTYSEPNCCAKCTGTGGVAREYCEVTSQGACLGIGDPLLSTCSALTDKCLNTPESNSIHNILGLDLAEPSGI